MRASTSQEELGHLLVKGKRRITSFLPVDKPDCDCFAFRGEWGEKISNMSLDDRKSLQEQGKVFDCPRSEGMKKYEIYCPKCGDLLGFVYALDDKLTDWCNLHYITESRIEKKERVEPEKYLRDTKLHKKGEIKMYKGKPKLKTYNIKASKWHGAMAVNSQGEFPVIECSCGVRLKNYKLKEIK